ncbi:carboxypeptidase-like regulatory domain-containing protein [Deinococcus sonorensis]|uniref:Carboxypeptidase-like regulatory domain-containing protein n=2 Tax=Deinococcus sonorensis TaxID=309891 RepID=A0AAU7UFQ3_9DEIO
MNIRSLNTARAGLLIAGLLAGGLTRAGTAAPAPYTMSGVVRTAAGQPVSGVEVYADNTLHYNMNAVGTTNAQGRYTISLPRRELGTWRGGARLSRAYHGTVYEFQLVPNDRSEFATRAGAVRDFTWKLTGPRPDGGSYGGTLWMFVAVNAPGFDLSRVEVTLTPDGPIIDGSAGKVIRGFLQGSQLRDIPIGRYRVTARYLPEAGAPQTVLIGARNPSTYERSMTSDFRRSNTVGDVLEFTVRLGEQPTTSASDLLYVAGEAHADVDLKGTVVEVCVMKGETCDQASRHTTTITVPGTSAAYRLDNLQEHARYRLSAWKDLNGDGRVNAGDLYGVYGADVPGTTVTAPNIFTSITLVRLK